jgi:hypothetical protein
MSDIVLTLHAASIPLSVEDPAHLAGRAYRLLDSGCMKTLLASLALAFAATAASANPAAKTSQQPLVGTLAAFEFDRGSAIFDNRDDSFASELVTIAAWGDANTDGLIVLDGHADPDGPQRLNLGLSFDRAQAIREALIEIGVEPRRIVIAAFGEGGPAGTRDRRVVAWGTRAGMKAIVARTRAIGPSIVSAGVISRLEMNPKPVVATR